MRPVGAAGGGRPPPSRMPDRTALSPAVRVTVTLTVPPATTLTAAPTQAPCEKSVERLARRGPDPSLTVMVSRRSVVSQSIA